MSNLVVNLRAIWGDTLLVLEDCLRLFSVIGERQDWTFENDTVLAILVLATKRLRHAPVRVYKINGAPYLADSTHCSAKPFMGLFCRAAFPHQYKAAALSMGKPDDAHS
jgi:hypothetical protein